MVISFIPTGPWKIKKPPQYVVETAFGTTPASPTFALMGDVTGISPNFGIQKEVVRVIGQRDPVTQTKLMEVFAGAFRYRPYDSTMMKYGVNLANEGTPAGTNAESMTIVWSMDVNGTEKYFGLQGVKTDKISVEISKDGGVVVGQDYRWYKSFLYQADLTAMGITTPTYIDSIPSTAPWTSLTGGEDPFSISATVWPTDRIKFDVNQSLGAVSPNGSSSVEYLGATIRECSLDFDVWSKDGTLHDNLMDLDELDGTYNIDGQVTTPSTMTITNMGFDSRTFNLEGNSKDFQRESIAATPNSLTLS